jgi:CheY-like chemotaxis protein
MRTIEESGLHLLNLINDILDLSKVESGSLEIAHEDCELEEICQASLRFVRQAVHKKQQELAYTMVPPGIRLKADPRRIKQVLVNLLGNATKFTAERRRLGLDVAGDRAARTVRLTVWDEGIGIAPGDLRRIFHPFVQIDSALARQYVGTGLGLALVQRLVDQHGGGVSVESVPGQGSRFTVGLPWEEPGGVPPKAGAAGVDPPSPGGPAARTGPAPHVLVTDDNEMNLSLITQYLGTRGYRVSAARSGAEAIEQARGLRPDVILMDIQMPGVDGLEATRRIRSEAALAGVHVIALTALAMPGDRERCLEAGADGYLTKPVELRQLLAELERLAGSGRS